MDDTSVISVNSAIVTGDRDGNGSDSKNSSFLSHNAFQLHPLNTRHDIVLSSSRYKGVISQANGHWGAQIYVNHQRIWLGTFKSEIEAAMAYDSAALKLRSGECHRNVPWTNITVHEPDFQIQFSTEAILNMIKDGSYPSKFAEYLKLRIQDGCVLQKAQNNGEIRGKQLFRKELTPSDVGKLNRLVIPKKFAVKYFPHIFDELERNDNRSGVQDTDIVFVDTSKRTWKFRYCYWRSSQSYVFTRGWNRFVREKGLRAKDVVIFSLLESNDRSNTIQNFCMIDVEYSDATCSAVVEEDANAEKYLPKMRLSNPDACDDSPSMSSSSPEDQFNQHCGDVEVENTRFGQPEPLGRDHKGLRLFGVQIV